jgi:hypothetical protein
MNGTIRLSSALVAPAAKSVARRSALLAIPVLIFAAFISLLTVLSLVRTSSAPPSPLELALPFVAVFAGGAGFRMVVTQRRATLAAVKANADPTTFWNLDGFVVIPYVRGAPDRTLSFKVPPAMRMQLANAGRRVAV